MDKNNLFWWKMFILVFYLSRNWISLTSNLSNNFFKFDSSFSISPQNELISARSFKT